MTELTEEAAKMLAEIPDNRDSFFPINLEPKPEIPQIHRALFAAKLAMPPVAKTGELELGSKKVPFTKIDDIRKHLYPVLAKFGIMVYLELVDSTDELQVAAEPMSMLNFADEVGTDGVSRKVLQPRGEVRDGRIPTTRYWATVTYRVRFLFVGDNSEESVIVKALAYDTNSDKAIGKATTAAVKRAFVETFDIVDGAEVDEDDELDKGNRAATTDRRMAGDRGQQSRNAAAEQGSTGTTRRSGPQRAASVPEIKSSAEVAAETGADVHTGELPPPNDPPAESNVDVQKARIRAATGKLSLSPAEVDAIASELTGKKTRPEWINQVTALKKVADELERRVNE